MPYFQTAKIENITKEHVLDFCKEIETHGNMKSLKKNALMFPAGYGKISKEEAYGIEGGIGPATYTDGSYDTHQNASEITKKWEGFFERIFDLDYEQRQTVNKGFGLIGIFQSILQAFNPTALVKAINTAPVLTGVFDALGQIGLARM